MKLSHKYTYLFDGFFEKYPNLASFKDLIEATRKYAKAIADQELKTGALETEKGEKFRVYYGALGEVLSEFWLRLFSHELQLAKIFDTSANQYCRGFDFVASSIFTDSLLALIQVKMRKDDLKTFVLRDLTTLFDEVERRDVLPQHVILMVPTSTLSNHEILSYKEGFQREYSNRMVFVGYRRMLDSAQNLPSTRGLTGVQEFIEQFREAVTETKVVTI